jgi:hypothetical protein
MEHARLAALSLNLSWQIVPQVPLIFISKRPSNGSGPPTRRRENCCSLPSCSELLSETVHSSHMTRYAIVIKTLFLTLQQKAHPSLICWIDCFSWKICYRIIDWGIHKVHHVLLNLIQHSLVDEVNFFCSLETILTSDLLTKFLVKTCIIYILHNIWIVCGQQISSLPLPQTIETSSVWYSSRSVRKDCVHKAPVNVPTPCIWRRPTKL